MNAHLVFFYKLFLKILIHVNLFKWQYIQFDFTKEFDNDNFVNKWSIFFIFIVLAEYIGNITFHEPFHDQISDIVPRNTVSYAYSANDENILIELKSNE